MKSRLRLFVIFGIITVLVFLTFFIRFNTAYEQIVKGVGLNASLLYYEPIPAQPGDVINIYLQIENMGGEKANKILIEFIDNYPFYITSEEDRQKYVEFIPSLEKYFTKYIARIDKNAAEGTYYVKVRFKMSNKDWQEAYFPIDIRTYRAFVSITNISINPGFVIPGGTADISMKIKNLAESKIKDLIVKLDLSGTSFSPLGTTNTRKIKELSGGEEVEYSFKIISSPTTTPNLYQIPIIINFTNEIGVSKTQEEVIGILVGINPELSVFIDNTEIFKDAKSGRLTIKFVNMGLTEIKLLKVEIQKSEDYEILSPTAEEYVGNIDIDDYETAEFIIKTEKNELDIPLKLSYRDALNREYNEERVLHLKLVDSKEYNGKGDRVGFYIILIILIGVVIFYFWRKKRRVKK